MHYAPIALSKSNLEICPTLVLNFPFVDFRHLRPTFGIVGSCKGPKHIEIGAAFWVTPAQLTAFSTWENCPVFLRARFRAIESEGNDNFNATQEY